MQNLFRQGPVILIWLSLHFFIINLSPVFAADKSDSPIIVDFASGTVGGVKIRGTIADISQAIGSHRISKSVEYLEGEPSDVYVISFGTHKIYQHWNAFSYTDPIFRTKEGLGVGSKIQDFNLLYAPGRVSQEEGFTIYYNIKNIKISVTPKFIDGKKQQDGLFTNSLVDEIWVW